MCVIGHHRWGQLLGWRDLVEGFGSPVAAKAKLVPLLICAAWAPQARPQPVIGGDGAVGGAGAPLRGRVAPGGGQRGRPRSREAAPAGSRGALPWLTAPGGCLLAPWETERAG